MYALFKRRYHHLHRGCIAFLFASMCAGYAPTSKASTFFDLSQSIKSKVYVGIGLGSTRLAPRTVDPNKPILEPSFHAAGQATLGLDVHRFLSAEMHIASLGTFELPTTGSLHYSSPGVSVLFHIGRTLNKTNRNGLKGYLRAGYSWLNVDVENVVGVDQVSAAQLLFGAGFEYGLKSGVGIRADYVVYSGDASLLQLGVVYRFGQRSSTRTGELAAANPAPNLPQNPTIGFPNPPQPVGMPMVPAFRVLALAEDKDQDGIANGSDLCRNTNVFALVDDRGCGIVEGTISGALFENNQLKLTDSTKRRLQKVIDKLKRFPNQPFLLAVHTDRPIDGRDNMQLSKRQAIAVARFMLSRGVAKSRFRVKSFGATNPVASNDTEQGRAANRRIEIVLQRQ